MSPKNPYKEFLFQEFVAKQSFLIECHLYVENSKKDVIQEKVWFATNSLNKKTIWANF